MGLADHDVVQLRFEGQSFGQQILMVRNYECLGAWPVGGTVQADLQAILNAVTIGGVNDIETPYLACLSNTYTLLKVTAQRIWPTRSAYTIFQIVGGAPGTNAGATTRTNTAGVITMRTAIAGREQRGNVHIGPTPDPAAVGGVLTAAYQALLNTLGLKLLTSFSPPAAGGALVSPVAYHQDHTTDLYQSFIIQTTARTERRRTVGVGK